RAEQARDAGQDLQRQLVQADDVAVPLGNGVELDDGIHRNRSSDFTRVVKMPTDRSSSPPSAPADQYQGNCQAIRSASSRSLAGWSMMGPMPRICCRNSGPKAARGRSTVRPNNTQAESTSSSQSPSRS